MKLLKELAKKLDKTQYPFTLSLAEVKYCKENDIVVVFGSSDDLMEFDGAIYEELGCYISGARGYATCYLDKDGNIFGADRENTPKDLTNYKSIKIWWCKDDKYSWQYETDIPHETFDIMEEDEFYCKGIVFYKRSLGE
jgi:hypothetical protein